MTSTLRRLLTQCQLILYTRFQLGVAASPMLELPARCQTVGQFSRRYARDVKRCFWGIAVFFCRATMQARRVEQEP
jgi:hypothetical protein